MTSKEIAEACGIFPQQIVRYARRLGVERGENGWPESLVAAITAERVSGRDPREGATATGFEIDATHLHLVRERADHKTPRLLASLKLTAGVRAKLVKALGPEG